ncbi:PREDICTED: leucine-rich repeat-containing protein 4-like [Branchiostoma belcheri]|uniref:Leucine-rich repeat-containing protein 4-like n=1 Tax=Branchiostoma belcheri TaxID=7741 RepID=A0A6P4ZTF7_BRABE|nr:PREDICTED: leucine-rich repeat-containing protein 4-like [Branchiostoma belcheri]
MTPIKKSIRLFMILVSVGLTLPKGSLALRNSTLCEGYEPVTCTIHKYNSCPNKLEGHRMSSERRSCAVCTTPNAEDLQSLSCGLPYGVTSLKLTGITFTHFSMASVGTLPRLRFLDLEGETLNGLADGGLSAFPSLQGIQIRQTEIRDIKRGWFNGLVNVKHLNLALNLISSIHPGAFQGLQSLSNLNLSYNQLTHLEEHHFSGLQDLVYLDLSFNKIQVIEKGSFKNIYLTLLDLKGNQLKSIKRHWFFGMIGIIWLSLEENMISTIEPGTFSSLGGISALHVRGNSLAVLWESWLRGLARQDSKYKTMLFLGVSPLRCTCANRWFATSSKKYFDIVPTSILCKYPLEMEGGDIFSIPTNVLPCPSPVVKITQDVIVDHDLQFRCQATWEEESSIFWVLPDNTTIVLPGLGEDERNANLTSQHFNISFQHDIGACGWTWETPSSVTTNCSHGLTAPNYAVRTVSVLVLPERLVHKWNGLSIHCRVKSFSGDALAQAQIMSKVPRSTTEEEHSITVASSPSPTFAPYSSSLSRSFTITTSTSSQWKLQKHPTTDMAPDTSETLHPLATTVDHNTLISSKIASINTSAYTQELIVLLPEQTKTHSYLNWYVMVALCALPVTIITLTVSILVIKNRQNNSRDKDTTARQQNHDEPINGTVSEIQSNQPNNNTPNEPYYWTIDDNDDEAVRHYGISKTCARYGQAGARSCVIGEQRNNNGNQATAESTAVPGDGEVRDRGGTHSDIENAAGSLYGCGDVRACDEGQDSVTGEQHTAEPIMCYNLSLGNDTNAVETQGRVTGVNS